MLEDADSNELSNNLSKEQAAMKEFKVTLGLLLLNLFIAFLGIGLVIPVLPTLMNELGISGTTVGYLTAAFAIAQLIVSPIAGKAVDKYGRKIMIVIGLFIFGFSELLFGLGKTIEVLFISRIFCIIDLIFSISFFNCSNNLSGIFIC